MTTQATASAMIRVDGQAYASADAMPPDIRQVYDRALAAIDGGTYRGPLSIFTGGVTADGYSSDQLQVSNPPTEAQAGSNTKIVVNGAEHADQMPADVCQCLTGDLLAEESTTWRVVIAGIVVTAMLMVAFLFGW